MLQDRGLEIKVAYQAFKWRNLASRNAVVTVIVVGVSQEAGANRLLFHVDGNQRDIERTTALIGPYLIPATKVIVEGQTNPLSHLTPMQRSEEHTSQLQSLMRISYPVFSSTTKLLIVFLLLIYISITH